MSALDSVEGCTRCDWRGDVSGLDPSDNDLCPGCGERGCMTTYYGPDELRAFELPKAARIGLGIEPAEES
jgi:hypothetical protein